MKIMILQLKMRTGKNVIIDDLPVMLDIVDTAGQDDYMSFRSSWMRDRDGFLLVFALNEARTMNGLRTFYDQLCNVHEDNMPPMVVIGNKSDLARQVTEAEGKSFAAECEAAAYIETSAKTGDNIDLAFATLIREIQRVQRLKAGNRPGAGRFLCFCSIL